MDIRLDYSGKQLGKYYLIQKLGNGGFGAVYKALDKVLRVEKAIKILEVSNPQEAYKLFSEASIPYKCQHNNIVKINSGELITFNTELLFIVDMDLANGMSVENLLKQKYVSINEGLKIIRDILFAVEYSHLQGIIHRDIKPANILMDNGVPKLSDFGLSTALGSVIIPWRWYVTHAAPETFVDNSVATVETDIFALGITLYRIINGIADWQLFLQGSPNAQKLMVSGKLIDKLPVASVVPDKVHKIVRKACNVSSAKRYHSAMEMRNAIEKLCPYYDWKPLEDYHWMGEAVGYPRKEIFLEPRRNHLNVIVTNNGRRSTQDSKKFDNILDAQGYMYDYIKQTIFH